MEDTVVVEHFYGVYLLYCTNPKYKGRTYIGYTVDPRRRINQHNGKRRGGAWRTSKKGPWNMVLIVHGFPNSTSALRFEWAWQHPNVSRRLKHVPKKKSSQKTFDFCLMVLSEMLKVGPWCRLPLTVRWLDYDFARDYSNHLTPPLHMPICYGKVKSHKINKIKKKDDASLAETSTDFPSELCHICGLNVREKELITCIKPSCQLVSHLICLSKIFSEDSKILPVQGTCPACNTNVLWGDLIRKKIGCYKDLQETEDSSSVSNNENNDDEDEDVDEDEDEDDGDDVINCDNDDDSCDNNKNEHGLSDSNDDDDDDVLKNLVNCRF